MKGLTGAILIAAMVFAGPAFAQFYKYLDKQGVVRFTDDINQVPQDQRVAARSYSESQVSETSAAEKSSTVKEEKPAAPEPPAASAAPLARAKIRSRPPARGWRPRKRKSKPNTRRW